MGSRRLARVLVGLLLLGGASCDAIPITLPNPKLGDAGHGSDGAAWAPDAAQGTDSVKHPDRGLYTPDAFLFADGTMPGDGMTGDAAHGDAHLADGLPNDVTPGEGPHPADGGAPRDGGGPD